MRQLLVLLLLLRFTYADPFLDSSTALDYLNLLRIKAGLVPYKIDPKLSLAAKNHTLYLLQNRSIGHSENPDAPGFSGKNPFHRLEAVGYPTREGLENISYGQKDFFGSIDSLFAAPYHRLAFLHPAYDRIGIATKYSSAYPYRRVFTYVISSQSLARACQQPEPQSGLVYTNICTSRKLAPTVYKKALHSTMRRSAALILWPYPDARDIPPLLGDEIPDPLPECKVSGYPISVTLNPAKITEAQVEEFTLYTKNGPVPATLLHAKNDPNRKLRPFEYLLLPLQRLQYDTLYSVRFIYRDTQGQHLVQWSFRTKKAPFSLLPATSSKQVHSSRFYTLYKAPLHCKDRVNGLWIKCPRRVKVKFERNDANSYNIYLKTDKKARCKYRLGGESFFLEVVPDN